jgi:hypothetical protein
MTHNLVVLKFTLENLKKIAIIYLALVIIYTYIYHREESNESSQIQVMCLMSLC